ncbi:rhodanese-like domain-containing protein [Streptomyces sp. MN03-5084-2B]|nr:rhodanese-like domain-containing protein [Streptomyces sp. MN03-5084-2B]
MIETIYLGWLIPWGTPLSLLGDTREQIAEAQRELVDIDRVASATTGTPGTRTGDTPLGSFPRADFGELAMVLDVRRNQEWTADHINGATHIPLHELLDRLAEVPDGEVWVHCAAGYRASIAASVLAANGQVVAIDDDFAHARLPMASSTP